MGDLDRQDAVEQAANGCLVAVALLAVLAIALVVFAWGSVAVPIAGGALVLSSLGLVAVEWATRG